MSSFKFTYMVCKFFLLLNSLHKFLLKSNTFDLSKENGTCLNRKTTVIILYLQCKDSKMFYYEIIAPYKKWISGVLSGVTIIFFYGEPIIHQLEIFTYWFFKTWMCSFASDFVPQKIVLTTLSIGPRYRFKFERTFYHEVSSDSHRVFSYNFMYTW